MSPSLPAGTCSASCSSTCSRVDAAGRGRGREFRAEQVHEPGQRPHAAADAVAFVQVAARHAAEVGPELLRVLPIALPVHHRRDVRAERDERRAVVERAGAERLDGLVVGRDDDRQAGRNAGRGRRAGRDAARDRAGQQQLEQLLAPHVELLQQRRVGAPLPGVGVDRPLQQDAVGRGVAELAGEAMRDVARRRRGIGDGGIVRHVGLVGARVHPAHDRLGQRAVGAQERLAAADRAQADADDLAGIALEAAERLRGSRATIESQRSSSGCSTMPGRGRLEARSTWRPSATALPSRS